MQQQYPIQEAPSYSPKRGQLSCIFCGLVKDLSIPRYLPLAERVDYVVQPMMIITVETACYGQSREVSPARGNRLECAEDEVCDFDEFTTKDEPYHTPT